jgi:hypothetical protein
MIRYNSTTDCLKDTQRQKVGALLVEVTLQQQDFGKIYKQLQRTESIDSGYNASSVGPITIGAGASVTVTTRQYLVSIIIRRTRWQLH